MTIYVYETGEMNGSSNVKIPLRNSDILSIENDDIAKLYPCTNNHPKRVSNCRQYFIELNIQGFDFSNGFKCIDFHGFKKSNNLSMNKLELNFCQDQSEWKHNLIPIKISKNDSDKVIDLLIYKNHYLLIKNLHIISRNRSCIYVCRRCFISYTSQSVLNKHKKPCGEQDITSLGLSHEFQLYWKKKFDRNPLSFRICSDFEVDIEIDNSSIGNKTTNIYKQNPVPY